MRKHRNFRTIVFGVAVFSAIFCGSCRVTIEDLDTWKGTVKGPGKIVAVILADKYDVPLRTHAAWALLDMERQDVDGLTELQRSMQKLDDVVRKQIIQGLVPLIEQKLKEKPDPEDEDPSIGAPPAQVRAKDSAFVLTAFADAKMRQRLTRAMIHWYVVDFEQRSLTGNYSAEQVVRRLGSPAATELVQALNAKLPQMALIKLAELIGQLGNPATKTKAGQRLVEIQREMESEKFRAWLRSSIKEQLSRDGKVDDERLLRTVETNQHKFINESALPAMKHLADQNVATERLLQMASAATLDQKRIEQRVQAVKGLDDEGRKKLHQQMLRIAAEKLIERRTRALQALEGNVTKDHLKPLLTLALDSKTPTSVRDYAFDRVGDIRSPDAIGPMWPLVQDEKNQRLRWRAAELILTLGGNKVLAEFFGKLPSGGDVVYEPEELEGYAARMSQMNPLPRNMAKIQLDSDDWWDRVIAIKFLERRGTKADVARLKRLKNDDTEVKGKGWKDGETVGKVAQAALASLEERLKQNAGPSAASAPKQK